MGNAIHLCFVSCVTFMCLNIMTVVGIESQPEEYFRVNAKPLYDSNECVSIDRKMMDETVSIEFVEDTSNIRGSWDEDTNTIKIVNPYGDVETVSHEVSHMTETFIERHQFLDPHFRQYIQGYWTKCVMLIVEHHQ